MNAGVHTSAPAVSVLITNWNGREVLQACLRSLQEMTHGLDYEVIVVDDASTDDSVRMVREEFDGVHLVVRTENGGFVRANNDGVAYARGRHVFLLNSDTVLVMNAVKVLSDYLDANPHAGICGGLLFSRDGTPQVSYGVAPSLLQAVTDALFLNDLFPRAGFPSRGKAPHPGMKEPFRTEYVSGADLMIRRSFVEQHGLFDEIYEAYCEDVDLCRRMRTTGDLEVHMVPGVRILHLGGYSYSKLGERHVRTQYQSYNRYLTKHYGRWYARCVRCLYAWHYGIKWCVRRMRRVTASGEAATNLRREEEHAWNIVRYCLRPLGNSEHA